MDKVVDVLLAMNRGGCWLVDWLRINWGRKVWGEGCGMSGLGSPS